MANIWTQKSNLNLFVYRAKWELGSIPCLRDAMSVDVTAFDIWAALEAQMSLAACQRLYENNYKN